MKHQIEYAAVKFLLVIARLLTFKGSMRLGRAVGACAYYLFPFRKTVVMTNLRAAFPEKSGIELRDICRRMYAGLGMTLFEYLTVCRLPRERIREMVVFDDPGLLKSIYDRNLGVIGFSGHFGSFEMLGAAIAANGIRVDAVVKAMRNPYVDRYLDRVREENGIFIIKKKEGFTRVVESLKQKHFIALVADQDAGDRGTRVTFLGIESSTPVGPAVAFLRTGAPVAGIFIVREGLDRYRAFVHEVSTENLPEETDEQIRVITQRFTEILEQYVRRYPDHYLWLHKRWKTAGLYT